MVLSCGFVLSQPMSNVLTQLRVASQRANFGQSFQLYHTCYHCLIIERVQKSQMYILSLTCTCQYVFFIIVLGMSLSHGNTGLVE